MRTFPKEYLLPNTIEIIQALNFYARISLFFGSRSRFSKFCSCVQNWQRGTKIKNSHGMAWVFKTDKIPNPHIFGRGRVVWLTLLPIFMQSKLVLANFSSLLHSTGFIPIIQNSVHRVRSVVRHVISRCDFATTKKYTLQVPMYQFQEEQATTTLARKIEMASLV